MSWRDCLEISRMCEPPRQSPISTAYVKVAGLLPSPHAWASQLIASLFDDLPFDHLLIVSTINKPGIFQACHQLIERGAALANAMFCKFAPDDLARLLTVQQRANDQKL